MSATVYAVANQKGGVAKTTTVLTLAAALAERGLAVLACDLDPQAGLTFSLGYDPEECAPTIHEVVTGDATLAETILQHPETDLVPSSIELAGGEVALLARSGREYLLRSELSAVVASYDIVLIDCPPSLGMLTLNALTAAHRLLIPVQCETLSHRGVAQLLATVSDVRRLTNPELEVTGTVATMYDPRTRHGRAVLADLERRYGLEVVGVPVRKSVRFAEAPHEGVSILAYDDTVPGAAAYRIVAARLAGLEEDPAWAARAGAPTRATSG